LKRLQASLLMLVLLAAFGCQGQSAKDVLWPDLNDPYFQTTREWTRHDSLSDGIDVLVQASATLKSQPWREAFITRYAETYALSEDERARLAGDQMRAHGEFIDIVLAVSSSDPKLSDIGFDDPDWRIFATQSEKRVLLSEIRPMEREDWPPGKLKAFFPYYKRWRKFYTLRLPRTAGGPLTLTVAGPAGTMQFAWPGIDGDRL
jgi:hypothetical protein